MAALFPSSVLLLVALLSWNVYCFPKKDWARRAPSDGGSSDMNAPLGLYRSYQGASAQSANDGPQPVKKGAYPSPKGKTASSKPSPDAVYEPPAAPQGSKTSQPTSDGGFQAGALDNYDQSVEYGDWEEETEDLQQPPPPPPASGFIAGELNHYSSSFEHGDYEEETEEQDLAPPGPYAAPEASVEEAGLTDVPYQWSKDDYLYYLFFTGQLPSGLLSHYSSDYEAGGDYYDDAEYERYDYPIEDLPAPEDPTAQDPVTYEKSDMY